MANENGGKLSYREQMEIDRLAEIDRIKSSPDFPEAVKATALKVLDACAHYETGGLVENCGGFTMQFGLTLDYGNWFPKGGVRIEKDGELSNAWELVELSLQHAKLYKRENVKCPDGGWTSRNAYTKREGASPSSSKRGE